MLNHLLSLLPDQGYQLVLVLFLSFLIGLEREETKRGGKKVFGGVRTFPLLGFLGYVVAVLGHDNPVAILMGFMVVGAFMVVSYWHKLQGAGEAGITTEITGLLIYLMGALVHAGFLWLAGALVVASLLLLEFKAGLEGLTERIAPEETIAFTKFLLLTAVILPMVRDQDYGPFRINPFKTWLVVVAVSGISYASYLLLKVMKGRGGIYLSGVLGGLYSSTITTVVLAKKAAGGGRAHEYSGTILTASGFMYLRIMGLVWMFNGTLARALTPAFAALAAVGVAGGWFWHRLKDGPETEAAAASQPQNPLELGTAFLFALLFLAILVLTHLALTYLGRGGIYSLAAIMGVTDVDPFIMGMTHEAGASTPLQVAAVGILISAACNNIVKGCYAYSFARGKAGRWSLMLLVALGVAGLLPVFWI